MSTKTIYILAAVATLLPSMAFAQAAQSPPTDAQSKRQQESPVVNNSVGTAGNPTLGTTPAPTQDGTANTTVKTDAPITSTAPTGANPNAVTGGKTAPLAPQN